MRKKRGTFSVLCKRQLNKNSLSMISWDVVKMALFQNPQAQQQGPYRGPAYGAPNVGGSDQLQFYTSNYNQYGMQESIHFCEHTSLILTFKIHNRDTEQACKQMG